MKVETQKLIIEKLLSSTDIFSRCIPIIDQEYFDPDVRPLVKFIRNYYEQYNSVPKLDYINSEFDMELKERKSDATEIKFTCNEIEKFCKQGALYNAIRDSVVDVSNGNVENFGLVHERIQKALEVSIQRDIGIEMFTNIESRLDKYLQTDIYESTGILGLDTALGGGLARKQVTLFSANSGGGKSLMMSNIGANYARRGFDVLQLALELTDQMIDLRNISILTGIKTSEWKTNIAEITGMMKQHKEAGSGSFVIKRIPGGSNALDIRSYLKLYELEYGKPPDVLIVDYLDLMSPNGGTRNKGIFDQDKEKTEELTEIAFDYDCITITASQQNREAINKTSPDQSIIAGGISKINTVDNYISIYMNPEMRLKGELFLYYLKTRSSSAVGSITQLAFNPDNLIISDTKTTTVNIISAIKNRVKKKHNESLSLPGIENSETMNVPDELCDIIVKYNNELESLEPTYEHKDSKIDLADDDSLWKEKKKPLFVLEMEDDNNYDNYVTF